MPRMGFAYASTLGGMRVLPGAWKRTAAGAGLLSSGRRGRTDHLRRDERAGGPDGRDQPRPGVPRRGRPRRGARGRPRRHRARRESIPARPRHPGSAAGDRRAPAALLRAAPRSRTATSSSRPGPPRRSPRRCSRLIDGPDDEVVVFEPYYDEYAACVALAGATMRTVPLRWPDFQPDLERLAEAVTDRTRIILVNDPHNPDGGGLLARGARGDRAPGAPARRADRDRRGVRAPHLRRAPRADRHPARRVGAHPDDLLGGQDVLGDRLEDRLGHRAPPNWWMPC